MASSNLNIVLIGDSESGKSTWLRHVTKYGNELRYSPGDYTPTLKMEENTVTANVCGEKIECTVYDTPGTTGADECPPANGVILFYPWINDDGVSFENAKKRAYQAIKRYGSIPIAFVSTKHDLNGWDLTEISDACLLARDVGDKSGAATHHFMVGKESPYSKVALPLQWLLWKLKK